ncbi:MAG: hypothetical protein AB8H80_12745 [Planctomycetota bacterium]
MPSQNEPRPSPKLAADARATFAPRRAGPRNGARQQQQQQQQTPGSHQPERRLPRRLPHRLQGAAPLKAVALAVVGGLAACASPYAAQAAAFARTDSGVEDRSASIPQSEGYGERQLARLDDAVLTVSPPAGSSPTATSSPAKNAAGREPQPPQSQQEQQQQQQQQEQPGQPTPAQNDAGQGRDAPNHWSLDLGVADTGFSIGNSPRWTGLRLNISDYGVEYVHGVNLTLWSSRERGIEEFAGLALGTAPTAKESVGLRVGLAATTASGSNTGIDIAGLAAVYGGDATGMHIGGLAAVSNNRFDGIQIGGLATVAEGGMTGLQLGGLATVSDKDIAGISGAGLAVVADQDIQGLHFAGLAVVAQGDIHGVGAGGLALVSQGRIAGIHGAGLGLVAEEGVHGIGIAGMQLSGSDSELFDFSPRAPASTGGDTGERSRSWNRGIMVAGLRADADQVDGVSIAGLINRSHDFDGLGISLHNSTSGLQRGVQIGLVNYAEDLRGVQIGLINHVPSNPPLLRWLPLINFRF